MNVRMTIDIPVHHLPALERTLAKQGLSIQPYIKNGVQRWMLGARPYVGAAAVPATLIAEAEKVPA